jgi:hypothetical protein
VPAKPQSKFSALSFGLRFLFALTLILLTYNPTGFSYIHWLQQGELGPEHLLGGVVPVVSTMSTTSMPDWVPRI